MIPALAVVVYAAIAVLVGRVIARQPGNDHHDGALLGLVWPMTVFALLLQGVLWALAAAIRSKQ